MIASAIVEEPSLNFTVPSSHVSITYNVNIQTRYAHQLKWSMYNNIMPITLIECIILLTNNNENFLNPTKKKLQID
jgi:hypothetical protein